MENANETVSVVEEKTDITKEAKKIALFEVIANAILVLTAVLGLVLPLIRSELVFGGEAKGLYYIFAKSTTTTVADMAIGLVASLILLFIIFDALKNISFSVQKVLTKQSLNANEYYRNRCLSNEKLGWIGLLFFVLLFAFAGIKSETNPYLLTGTFWVLFALFVVAMALNVVAYILFVKMDKRSSAKDTQKSE